MLGALVLTGGASSRMGRDKAGLEIGGVRAVDHVAALAKAAGAKHIATVGGLGRGYPHVEDPIALGGPVGGVVAGAEALAAQGCGTVLVLAVDAPTVTLEDLQPLFSPAGGAAYAGFPLPFVAPLARRPNAAEARWPLTRLLDAWGLERLPVPPDAAGRLKGANTPAEFDALRQATAAGDPTPR